MPEGALQDPHELLRDLRRFIGRRRGDAILMGEVNLPPDQQRAFFGDEDGDELHMVLSFVINQAMYLALARGDATPLREALGALPEIPGDCQWANFVRNHDELTLDKLSEEERAEVFAAFGPDESLQLYGRGLRRRLPTMVGGDERRIRMLYSLAFALPGTPVLFYGEEIGMAENLDIPGRYSVRAPMQWSDDVHGGFSTAPEGAETVRPVVASDGWGPDRVSVAAQRRDPGSLLNWMERLIRRRRECPELGWGRATLLDAGHAAVFCHRVDWEQSTVLALHSFAGERLEARVELEPDVEEAVDLFDGEHGTPRDGALAVGLEPYGARWFRLRRGGARLPP
jgi:maltose alpha-D-glucosyltransferase/alpha-amylase